MWCVLFTLVVISVVFSAYCSTWLPSLLAWARLGTV